MIQVHIKERGRIVEERGGGRDEKNGGITGTKGVKKRRAETLGGLILQMPACSAIGRIRSMYSIGSLFHSSSVGSKTGHAGGGENSSSLRSLRLRLRVHASDSLDMRNASPEELC